MKKLLGLTFLIVILMSLAVVSCSTPTETVIKKTVVATDATWAPFEYIDPESKEIVGFDIDVMNAIAADQQIKIEFKNVALDPMLAGIAAGMYDIGISSIVIDDEKKKNMLLSDPYYTTGQMVVVALENSTIINFETLRGKVGAQIDTTGAKKIENNPNVIASYYETIELAFQHLINGVLDAVICDDTVVATWISLYPDKIKSVGSLFDTSDYGIAVTKTKPELLKQVNAGITSLKNQGMIDLIFEKWFVQP